MKLDHDHTQAADCEGCIWELARLAALDALSGCAMTDGPGPGLQGCPCDDAQACKLWNQGERETLADALAEATLRSGLRGVRDIMGAYSLGETVRRERAHADLRRRGIDPDSIEYGD